jgi:hypothetical protein
MSGFQTQTEEQREVAIGAFRKGMFRILDEPSELDRQAMAKRLESDGYIGSALRRIIVETSGKAEAGDDGVEEATADARLLLYGSGFILECIYDRFGPKIGSGETRNRTKSASSIIINQIGHEGCLAMEGFEVQDLLCRLSGLYAELGPAMKGAGAKNAAALCMILAERLARYCGRLGSGDRRSYKQQNQNTAKAADRPAHRPPSPGRMGG